MPFPVDSVLQATELCCVRGDSLLFEDLDLRIGPGEIWQVHGANGSGKTSLLRILCGLAIPERGRVTWNDISIDSQRDAFNSNLSYVGHHNGIKGELNPVENLEAAGALTASRDDTRPETVLERIGLFGFEDIPCRYLSAGQKRRVALARLLLSAAQLWILDEPVTALDAAGVTSFQEILEDHAENGGMVVITSHQPLAFGATDTRKLQL
jgi:heme exporter protein A